jgi:inner membrane protein
VCGLWGWRFVEHGKAVQVAAAADLSQVGTQGGVAPEVWKVSASPYPIDLFHWHTVVDTPGFYRMAEVDTRTQTSAPAVPGDTVFKTTSTLATLAAKRSWLGEAYLDWSQYPVVSQTSLDPNPDGPVSVEFRDLRFAYDTPLLKMSGRAPLSGLVLLNQDHRVIGMEMDGRVQH